MEIEAVLFDIDGTLVDSNEGHVRAWAQAFAEAGHPQDADAIRRQIGKGGDLLVPALLPGVDEAAQQGLSAAHGRLFKALFLDAVEPFPDARALIERVHASGRKAVLASSADRAELDHYVALLDVKPLLAAATSIDDAATSKPAPDIFGAALAKARVDPARALVVGDTPYDVEAATKAGVRAVGVTSGPWDEGGLREAGAVAVYRDVAEILARFEETELNA